MLPNHHSSDDANPAIRPLTGVAEELRSLQLSQGERRKPVRAGRRRSWFWILGLVVLVGCGGLAYGVLRGEDSEQVEAIVFSSRTTTDTLLDVTGYVVPRKRINISPEVGGIIRTAPIEEGMKVKKGDLLIQVDDLRFKAEYDQARAALKVAMAQYEELKTGSRPEEIDQGHASRDQAQAHREFLVGEVTRARRSGVGHGVSVAEMEKNYWSLQEAEATLRVQKSNVRLLELGPRQEKVQAAEAEVNRAAALLSKAQFYYERTRIVAPCDGTVLEKKAEVGEAIHPEVVVGYLCVLADLSEMEAEVDVQERDLALLKQAQECQVILDAYSDRVYRGRFSRLQPQVNRQRGVVRVKVTILDPDQDMLPDMNCRVIFTRDKKSPGDSDLPLIPEQARIKEGDQWIAYVFDGKAARRRAIDCGRIVGSSVQVVGGLKQGDIVLVAGRNPLYDGGVIRPRLSNPGQSPH